VAELRDFSGIDLLRNDKGAIRACEHNARELILTMPRFRDLHFDEFRYRILLGRRDWTDADERELLCLLQASHQVPRLTLGQVRNAVQVVAQLRARDSLRDYVQALPAWDGTPRIEQAFHDAWGAENSELVRAASRNFFVALIARALRPGAQVDTLWAFEGPQGVRKSQSMRALGRQFHAEIVSSIGTHDFFREQRGLWIAEMSELDSLRGREASTIKRLLSAPSDRFAEKYQTHAVAYPRRAVAVATTNEAQYWQDPTGARRLIPVRTGEIRVDLIEAIREQWFAEARQLFEQGATWWEFPTSILEAQEERQQIDPWEDTLRGSMLNGRMEHAAFVCWPTGWISSAELMARWLDLAPHQQGQPSSVRLGRVMRRLGYEPHRQGKDREKDRERGWVPADTSKASDA
jgi:predicted P-loop ATPase